MNNRCCPQLCKYNLSFIFIAINSLMVICLNPNVTNMPTHFLDRDISTGLLGRFDDKHFYASTVFLCTLERFEVRVMYMSFDISENAKIKLLQSFV